MGKFYTKMGRYNIGGVANGQGHTLIEEENGIAIPSRNTVVIDMAQVAKLQEWSKELLKKFESS